jgi:2-amino-4-hydroxy-6-hydroxymethyldihydropteridine diphosphokinase
MARVYLGLGSNVGDSVGIIGAAYSKLTGILANARISSYWRSRALYVSDQSDFINAVVAGDTEMSPQDLLTAVNGIEAAFGRDRARERPKGPRSLDIDILLYGAIVLDETDLIIPHSGLKERRFALMPLLELDQNLLDPLTGKSYASILESLPPQGIYLLE